MNFQQQKLLLQKHLNGRLISDAVFYRVKKELKLSGIDESQYQSIFPLVGHFNANSRRLVIPPDGVLSIYSLLKTTQVKLTCFEFYQMLAEKMTYKPKDRKVKNKSYLSPTWYEWFRLAGIPYEKNTVYSVEKYMIVTSYALCWEMRKKRKEAIDIEAINLTTTGETNAA